MDKCDEEKPTKICDLRMGELEKLFNFRLEAVEKATRLAANTLEKRLEGMNEFREQLNQQADTFMPRSEYSFGHTRLEQDVRELRESKAKLEGKADQSSVNLALLLGIFGMLISILSVILSFIHFGK
jgi:Fe2+ transport system protein B